MSLNYAKTLGLKVWKTNIGAKKIYGSALGTFGMVIANFWKKNKISKPKIFQKIFLVADIILEVILRMHFLKIKNVDMLFGKKTLIQKSYTTNGTIPTIEQVQIIDSKIFIIEMLIAYGEIFVNYVAIQKRKKIPLYSEK